jgi:hypothetical protein
MGFNSGLKRLTYTSENYNSANTSVKYPYSASKIGNYLAG